MSGFASAQTACRGVQVYFGRLPPVNSEDSRALWRERLEVLWRQGVQDVSEQRPGAVRAAVAVAQRAAALDGLDAPTKVELQSPDAIEFRAVVMAMRALTGQQAAIEGDIFAEVVDD